jgi:hypothetical protein
MRFSVFVLPHETAHLAFSATVPPDSDQVWHKRYSQKNRYMSKEDYKPWREKVAQIAKEPHTAAEIREAAGIPDSSIKCLLNRIAFEGRLLRVGANGPRSNIISYVNTNDWAGDKFVPVDSNKALAWFAGEYLRAFGPARIRDFQWWSGITVGKAKKAIEAQDTVEIHEDYPLLKKDLSEFESFKISKGDSLAILPRWDSYTMGYAPDGRDRFVDPAFQDRIYGSIGATGGNALGTILLNGLAHGSWDSRFAGSKMVINLNMIEKPSKQLDEQITEQFNDIATLLNVKKIEIVKNS